MSIKSLLESLLPNNTHSDISQPDIRIQIQNFCLFCAALASSETTTSEHLLWIPHWLWIEANSAFTEIAEAFWSSFGGEVSGKVRDLGLEGIDVSNEKRLVIELMPEVLPLLKGKVSESSIGKTGDGDEISAASARAPVAYAIVAAHQFRWFVTQVAR